MAICACQAVPSGDHRGSSSHYCRGHAPPAGVLHPAGVAGYLVHLHAPGMVLGPHIARTSQGCVGWSGVSEQMRLAVGKTQRGVKWRKGLASANWRTYRRLVCFQPCLERWKQALRRPGTQCLFHGLLATGRCAAGQNPWVPLPYSRPGAACAAATGTHHRRQLSQDLNG